MYPGSFFFYLDILLAMNKSKKKMASNISRPSEDFRYWKDQMHNIERMPRYKLYLKKFHPPNSKLQESIKLTNWIWKKIYNF